MQKLLHIGAIQQSGTKTIRGGTARLFKTVNPSYGLEMDWGESQFSVLTNNNRQDSSNMIFKEFIKDNFFNGLIVVGAPDPMVHTNRLQGMDIMQFMATFSWEFVQHLRRIHC